VLAATAVGGAFAGAQTADSGETVTLCSNDSSGRVRVVDDVSDCRRNEAPLTLNEQGPAGPPGPQGPQGPPGPGAVHWGAHQANGTVIASSPGVSIFPGPPPPGGGVNLINVTADGKPVDLTQCAITATLNGRADGTQVGEVWAVGGTGGLTVATHDSGGGSPSGNTTPIAFSWAAFC
jgi:hypothetical protein